MIDRILVAETFNLTQIKKFIKDKNSIQELDKQEKAKIQPNYANAKEKAYKIQQKAFRKKAKEKDQLDAGFKDNTKDKIKDKDQIVTLYIKTREALKKTQD